MNYLLKVYLFSRHKKTSETGLVVKDARLFICFDFLGNANLYLVVEFVNLLGEEKLGFDLTSC